MTAKMIGEKVPMSRLRRRIGAHMVESLATSPHVTLSVDVDYHAIAEVRRRLNSRWQERSGSSLTYLPFVARAVCEALAEFPDLNASIEGSDLLRWRVVNLGIAVDLGGEGLIVPVIPRAEAMTLAELATATQELASAAMQKRLTPDDVQGATFTITSPGADGADRSSPIINQPQVAILAIDAIRSRPVVLGDESVAAHPVGALSLSFDHRAVDGVYASRFLRAIQNVLESAAKVGTDV